MTSYQRNEEAGSRVPHVRDEVCRSPGDDKLRSKYVSEDYKYACLACVKAREGHILCTRLFKASKSEIGSGDSSTASAMAASCITHTLHTLAVDLSRIRWASCNGSSAKRLILEGDETNCEETRKGKGKSSNDRNNLAHSDDDDEEASTDTTTDSDGVWDNDSNNNNDDDGDNDGNGDGGYMAESRTSPVSASS